MTLSFAPERIEMWPLAKLQPYARNAKAHGADQVAKIAASMAEFGWTVPCLVAEDGELIAGHGRVLAATQLGLTEAPVIVLGHLTEAQRRAYRIADNKLTELGTWDEALLSAELNDLLTEDFDLSLVGFSDGELDKLLAFVPEGDGEEGGAGGSVAPVTIAGGLGRGPFVRRVRRAHGRGVRVLGLDADGGEARVGGDQRNAVAIAGFAPHGFALAQVGVDLLQQALGDHRADHLGGGTTAQALGQRQGDALGSLRGGAQDQGLGVGKLGHRGLPYRGAQDAGPSTRPSPAGRGWRDGWLGYSACSPSPKRKSVIFRRSLATLLIEPTLPQLTASGSKLKWSSLSARSRASIASISAFSPTKASRALFDRSLEPVAGSVSLSCARRVIFVAPW